MKRYLKYIWFFILAFIPQLVWAGNSANNIINQSWASLVSFTPTSADWSVRFLGQIFGNVGDVLTGAQRTIIGELFGIFNAAMMALVALLIIYIVIKVILEACILGPEMGKKIGAWVMLRTAIGVSMLVPFKTGYSIIQVIIMWAVIQGVGLADHAWIAAIDFLRAGGSIFVSTQQASNNDPRIVRNETLDTVGKNPQMHTESSKPDNVGATDVLRSLVCMHVVEQSINNQYADNKQDMALNPTRYPKQGTAKYNELLNKYNQQVSLQPYTDTKDHILIIPYIAKNNPNYNDLKKFNGACSVYDWNAGDFTGKEVKDDTCADGQPGCGVTKQEADSMVKGYTEAKQTGLTGMVNDLDQLAQNIANSVYNDQNNPASLATSSGTMLENAAASYQMTINPSVTYAASLEYRASNNWNSIMTNYGWAAAGEYYVQISKNSVLQGLNSPYNQKNYLISINKNKYPDYDISQVVYPPSVNKDIAERSGINGIQYIEGKLNSADKAKLEQALTIVDGVSGFQDQSTVRYQAFDVLNKNNTIQQQKDEGSSPVPDLSNSSLIDYNQQSGTYNKKEFNLPGHIPGIGFDASFGILSHQVNKAIDKWVDLMVNPTNQTLAPMDKLQQMGVALVEAANNTWHDIANAIIGTGIGIISTFGIAGIATSTVGAATGNLFGVATGMAALGTTIASAGTAILGLVMSTAFYALPLVIAITAPMFLTGAILSTYLPFIPFMFFTFGVISWLIFVVEAMAAAPLVAMGVTHPEGHDLMGKANQAIMLWLSVFLRPLAMIIGLIGGIVLLYVATEVLNAGFGGFIDTVFSSSINQFQGVTLILIYTFIMVALVNQCFGMIYVIPEKIMRWIGLAPDHSDAPQLAESVKGGITPFIQGAGDGAGKVSGEGSKGIGQSAGQVSQSGADIGKGAAATREGVAKGHDKGENWRGKSSTNVRNG